MHYLWILRKYKQIYNGHSRPTCWLFMFKSKQGSHEGRRSLMFNVYCCNRKCQYGETALQRLEFLNFWWIVLHLRSCRKDCFFSARFHWCISDNTNEIAKSICIVKYAWQKRLYFTDTHTDSGQKKFCFLRHKAKSRVLGLSLSLFLHTWLHTMKRTWS